MAQPNFMIIRLLVVSSGVHIHFGLHARDSGGQRDAAGHPCSACVLYSYCLLVVKLEYWHSARRLPDPAIMAVAPVGYPDQTMNPDQSVTYFSAILSPSVAC